MTYQVIAPFKVKTSKGEMDMMPDQIVTLSDEKALKLLSEGKIAPNERAAYKIYSELLQSHIWVVVDEKATEALRTSHGIIEAIYTLDEIRLMRGIGHDALRTINAAKEIFEYPTVEEIIRGAYRK